MDIYINKLTLIGTEENIDTFFQEQVVDGRMSFSSIIPMPEDFIQDESFDYNIVSLLCCKQTCFLKFVSDINRYSYI